MDSTSFPRQRGTGDGPQGQYNTKIDRVQFEHTVDFLFELRPVEEVESL